MADDDPHAMREDESPDPSDVERVNVVDEYRERAIDRFAQGAIGTTLGSAMIGAEKGMGLRKQTEETAEIREAGEPEPDPDDPIQVTIDLQKPENSRVVYRLRPPDEPERN